MTAVGEKDVEMAEEPQPAPANSATSTLQHLKEIASLIESGAHEKEGRRIVRAVRLTVVLRRKLRASIVSAFVASVIPTGSEAHTRLSSFLPKHILTINQSSLLIQYKKLGFLDAAFKPALARHPRRG